MRWIVAALVCGCLVPALAGALAAAAGRPGAGRAEAHPAEADPVEPGPLETDRAAALFDAGELHDIWIHINARDWEQLLATYRENTYYPADIEWRGLKVRNAGIRARGRTSRTDRKPGLRIDFNRYVTGQTFLGLKSLVLDNLWQDASMLREQMAMRVFDRMGLPAPRESHARLFVGSGADYAGVYGVVEVVDKDFLERVYGENDGHLYEYHWQDQFRFDVARPDVGWYAARFEPKTREAEPASTHFGPIRGLMQAVLDADPASLEGALAPYLDLRAYITHIAIENYLSQPDGLLGGLGMNNFYLYRPPGTQLSRLITWDQDLAFEWLDRPTPWHNVETNTLARKIWAVPELRRQYLRTLLEVASLVETPAPGRDCPEPEGARPCGWLEADIVQQYARIREAALADPRTPHTNEAFEETVAFLRRFVRERGAVVRGYVAQVAPDLTATPRASGRLPIRRPPVPTR